MPNTCKHSFLHMSSLQWRPHSFNSCGIAQVNCHLFFPSMGETPIPGTVIFLRQLSCPTLYSLSMVGPGYQSNLWDSQDHNSSSFSSDFACDSQEKKRKTSGYDRKYSVHRKYSTSYSVLTMCTVKRIEDRISSVCLSGSESQQPHASKGAVWI